MAGLVALRLCDPVPNGVLSRQIASIKDSERYCTVDHRWFFQAGSFYCPGTGMPSFIATFWLKSSLV